MDNISYKTYIKFAIDDYLQNKIGLDVLVITMRTFKNTNDEEHNLSDIIKITDRFESVYKRMINQLIKPEEFNKELEHIYSEL
jgi:hypothetical protein